MAAAQERGDDHRAFQRRLTRKAFGVVVVAALALFLLDWKGVARGLLLGSLFSVLNFALLARAVEQQVKQTKRKATLVAFGSIGVRWSLLAVPLVVALKAEGFEVWAVVLGLFTVPLAIYCDQWLGRRRLFGTV